MRAKKGLGNHIYCHWRIQDDADCILYQTWLIRSHVRKLRMKKNVDANSGVYLGKTTPVF
ncbi:conserved hypothetical protein [Ricinus communis]|uniref:Uncharacterized protein n=1 Tax=Ricinus communis TaxID=3988 RepID=B9SV34_RICCO|nr:conserved hypothetical protein [Ricinus communis]